MRSFVEYTIQSMLNKDSEFYCENILGVRTEGEPIHLPGRKIYKVIDNDEEHNVVTIQDEDGKEYKFDQAELAKSMAEDAGA